MLDTAHGGGAARRGAPRHADRRRRRQTIRSWPRPSPLCSSAAASPGSKRCSARSSPSATRSARFIDATAERHGGLRRSCSTSSVFAPTRRRAAIAAGDLAAARFRRRLRSTLYLALADRSGERARCRRYPAYGLRPVARDRSGPAAEHARRDGFLTRRRRAAQRSSDRRQKALLTRLPELAERYRCGGAIAIVDGSRPAGAVPHAGRHPRRADARRLADRATTRS